MPPRDDNSIVSAAANAASAAANSAAATVLAFSNISEKLDRGIGGLHERFNVLDKNFAVHVEKSKNESKRLDELEQTVNGDEGIAAKVRTLWAVDRVRLWAVRGLVGLSLTIIGYAIRHYAGWGG